MVPSLVGAAFVMGLAGGPHCVAMCGPACAGIARVVVVHGPRPPRRDGALPFHAGRVAGYALAGAAAAQAVDSLAWLSTQTAALRPLWTLLHLAVLGWGLSLLLLGRQPAAVGAAGRRLWGHVRPLAPRIGGAFTVGLLWACVPCGLLYSALLAASLSGGPAAGALSMALFAAGSALSLVLAPRLFAGLRRHGEGQRSQWGARAAGGLVVLAAAWSLWMDVARRVAIWCGYA
ncbi:MAG: sulfite exporter TauE/SafE family protein [Ramlibacter sp.]